MKIGDKVKVVWDTEYVGEVKCIQDCGCVTVVSGEGIERYYVESDLEVLT